MKQEMKKKAPKWLLPVIIAAAVLVVAGVLLAIFLPGGQQNAETGLPKLYWNVDRLANLEAESGMSIREPGADGLYTIRFAVDGELVEFKAADKRLVNRIDFLDVVCLVLDADGMVVDAMDPKSYYKELVRDYFAKSFDGKKLSINSSQAMNGMAMELDIPETAGVYDVRPEAEVVGAKTTAFEPLDKVIIYTDQEDVITHVFLTERMVTSDVYHRIDRFYEKGIGTTREPDEKGVYTIPFAHKGQQVELKCRDKDVVTMIDSKYYANAQMGLLFDEEGYITATIPASQAIRGVLLFNDYTVTGIEGDQITLESVLAKNKDVGIVGTMTMNADCEIYLIEDGCEADFIGQAVPELKINDTVYVYSDLEGTPKLIYISRRKVDSPMYYNITAKYSSTTKETTRKPDEKGWYVFDIAGEGKQLTLKTKDKAIATKLDSAGTKCVGLKLNGTIIEEVYSSTCVCGNSSLANRFVTESMGTIVRAVTRSDFTSGGNYMMASDCKVYDVSGDYGVPVGSEIELRKYDFGTGFLNEAGEICYFFVNIRYEEDTKLYYNYSRSYDSTLKETKRTPDENGYYVMKMACEGKTVEVKTKDKAMVTWIDKHSPAMVALKVSGGIVKEAHRAESAFPASRAQMQGVEVTKVNSDGTFEYATSTAPEGKPCPFPLKKDTSIYNVTGVYNTVRGEKTKLQPGDKIYPLVNCETQTFHVILVTNGREVEPPLYYKLDRQYNFTTKETTREPDAEGWYVYQVTARGEITTVRTKDRELATAMDSRSGVFGLLLDGDVIKQVYTYTYVKDLVETKVGNGYVVTAINGNEMTLTDLKDGSATYGNEVKVPLSKKCEIYNVSSYAEQFGAKTTLGVGDKVSYYANAEGQALYVYITAQNTRKAGYTSVCEHCNKEVVWTPFTGTTERADTHYYLPADASYSQLTIGWKTSQLLAKPSRVQYEIILDLNGHTLTGATRAFIIYGTLSILDSAGGGVVQGNTGTALQLSSQGGATLNLYGGTLKPGANIETTVSRGGTFHGSACIVNIYGGTIEGGTAGNGGVAYLNNGELNIYGGTVKGGAAIDGSGGCFYLLDTVVNMTGGTIEGGTATSNGGAIYLHKNSTGSTMTMSGGTIVAGEAEGTGDAIAVSTDATFTITGGKIDGELFIAAAAKETLFAGTPEITLLKVPAGKLIGLGELKQGAAITVSAEGAFTEENSKAADYAGYFHTLRALDTVTEVNKSLVYTKYVPDGYNFNNGDLVFDEGTTNAVCPSCGDKVTWTALTQEAYAQTAYGATSDGEHLYFAEDITYTGEGSFLAAPNSGSTACVHLNGKNVTSTGTCVFIGSAGTLNIMGNGTVAGYGSTASTGSAVAINTSAANGIINLYGGTYATYDNSVAYTIGLNDNGGTINLYKDVTVNGNSRNRYIRVGEAERSNAFLGIYGATINGRVRVEKALNTEHTITVVVENATIKGDLNLQGGSTVNLTNVSLGKNLNLNADCALTLAGQITIAEGGALNVANDCRITLGELAEGVVIPVSANGVFTQPNDNAAAYLNRFVAAVNGDSISATEDGKALQYVKWNGNLADNSNLVFDEGTTNAVCPVCREKVTWTALTAETAKLEGHMYLAGDVTYEGNKYCNADTTCLHLNGFKVESTTSRPIQASTGGTLNVMGNGTVKGVGSSYNPCSVGAWGGDLNLYGGTYEGSTSRVIGTSSGGGANVAIYAGATVKGSVLMRGTESAPMSLLIAGGTIEGQVRTRGAYGTIDITGGNFTATKLLYEEDGGAGALNVNITGGTFAFTTLYSKDVSGCELVPVITGGTFAIDPSQYVPEGYAAQLQADNTYSVSVKTTN